MTQQLPKHVMDANGNWIIIQYDLTRSPTGLSDKPSQVKK